MKAIIVSTIMAAMITIVAAGIVICSIYLKNNYNTSWDLIVIVAIIASILVVKITEDIRKKFYPL